jgi:hypothetical protein
MSTDANMPEQAQTLLGLSLKELAVLLVKHYGLNMGIYNLSLTYRYGSAAIGPNENDVSPGVVIGLSEVGLVPSSTIGPSSVDAALVNPEKKPRKKMLSSFD